MNIRILVSVVAVGLLSAGRALPLPILDTVVNPANGHTYLLFEHSTWTDAEAAAVLQGGHLATINDLAEQQWVWNLWGAVYKSLWIGLSDKANEGTFVWSSGEPVTFTWWGNTSNADPNDDEPNDLVGGLQGSDYVHMWEVFPEAGGWNDESNRSFIDPWQGGAEGWRMYGVAEIVPSINQVPDAGSTILLLGMAASFLNVIRRRTA